MPRSSGPITTSPWVVRTGCRGRRIRGSHSPGWRGRRRRSGSAHSCPQRRSGTPACSPSRSRRWTGCPVAEWTSGSARAGSRTSTRPTGSPSPRSPNASSGSRSSSRSSPACGARPSTSPIPLPANTIRSPMPRRCPSPPLPRAPDHPGRQGRSQDTSSRGPLRRRVQCPLLAGRRGHADVRPRRRRLRAGGP